MSIRKIVTKTGLIKWEIRYHRDGRGSKRVAFRFNTKADAETHLAEQISEKRKVVLGLEPVCENRDTTFQDEAQFWLEHRAKFFSPSHQKRVSGILNELLPEIGSLPPKALHAGRLAQIQSDQLSKGAKPATVNRKTEVLVAILNFSARSRRIPYNPAVGFQKLKLERDDMLFWERFEVEKFLNFTNKQYPEGSESRWIYVVYLLALNTGLRAGEIWGLLSEDLKRDGRVLHIQRKWDRVIHAFGSTKGKRARLVPCNEEVRRELFKLMEKRSRSETIFLRTDRKPICHDDFANRIFERDVDLAGVKKIRFHDLRHTATTLMIASGLDLKTVKEICGHKNIQTTMNYVHMLGDSIINTAENFVLKPTNSSATNHLRLIKS